MRTTLRRRHAILQRPPTGQLILEALGISRRRLTLSDWAPRLERDEALSARRQFFKPAPPDPKSVRPSWPATKAALATPPNLLAPEPVPEPAALPEQLEATVWADAAEAVTENRVEAPGPAAEDDAARSIELTEAFAAEAAAADPTAPARPAPPPSEQAPNVRPVPTTIQEPRHREPPNVESTVPRPGAEAPRPKLTGPMPYPAATEASPALETRPPEPSQHHAPTPAPPDQDLPAPAVSVRSAEVAAQETWAGAEEPVVTQVTPPASRVAPLLAPLPQAGGPGLVQERSIASPAEVISPPGSLTAAPPNPVLRSPPEPPIASQPSVEPPRAEITGGGEPVAATTEPTINAGPLGGEPAVLKPLAAEPSGPAPVPATPMAWEPIGEVPRAAELIKPEPTALTTDSEPAPAAVAQHQPAPAGLPSESPPPSWTPIETRQARPPAHRREATPHQSAPGATRSETPEPATTPDPFGESADAPAPVGPLEWLARLQRAHGPSPAPGTPSKPEGPARAPSQGQPISMANRELLEPMIGIDVGSVRVHQGAEASQAAAALQADAVVIGEQIVMGAGHQDSDPKTVGLLGHELLHVARQRSPRFVPPILRGMPRSAEVGRPPFRAAARPQAPPALPGHRAPGVTHAAEEEAMALVVEAATIAAGRDRNRNLTRGAGPSPAQPPAEGPESIQPLAAGERQAEPEAPRPWGTLPAPWEPMPSFETGGSAPGSGGGTGATGGTASPSTNAGRWPVTTTAPIQAAGADRQVPDQPTHDPHGPATPGGPPGKIDLDALAKQVYTVLKRRLAGERRRAQ